MAPVRCLCEVGIAAQMERGILVLERVPGWKEGQSRTGEKEGFLDEAVHMSTEGPPGRGLVVVVAGSQHQRAGREDAGRRRIE